MTRPTYILSLIAVFFTLSAQGLVLEPRDASPTSLSLPARGAHRRADGVPIMKPRQEGVPNPEWPPSTTNPSGSPNSTITPTTIPTTNPNNPNPTTSPNTGSNAGFPRSGPCTEEGQWICNTSSFQRCASGFWSSVMDVAAGTECTPDGETDDFKIGFDTDHNGTDSSGGHRNGTRPSLNTSASALENGGGALSVLTNGQAAAALMLGVWALALPSMLG